MTTVDTRLLNFVQTDLFEERDQHLSVTLSHKLQEEMYDIGLTQFTSQLSNWLNIQLRKEFKSLVQEVDVIEYMNKLYLFTQDSQYLIFEMADDLSPVQKATMITENVEFIKEKAWSISEPIFRIHFENKQVLEDALQKVVAEKKAEGVFNNEYPFYKHSSYVGVKGKMYATTDSFTAHVHGVYVSLRKSTPNGPVAFGKADDSMLFDREPLSFEEAVEIINNAIPELTKKYNAEPHYYVKDRVMSKLVKITGLPRSVVEDYVVISTSGATKLSVQFRTIIVPLSTDEETVLEAARFVEIMHLFATQNADVKETLRHFEFKNVDTYVLSKGILPLSIDKEFAENLVDIIENQLRKAKEFVEASIKPQMNRLPAFGKAFFIENTHSFTRDGNTFELYSYRLPDSKKTKKVAFENGMAISLNRYFRVSRKERKSA